MSEPHAYMTLRRIEPEQLTLESLAVCAGVHPALIKYFVEYGLIDRVVSRPGEGLAPDNE